MPGWLLVNPRAGSGSRVEEVCAAAAERGIETRLLRPDEDAGALARAAAADVLGVAGGDGSLAPVLDRIAEERGIKIVKVNVDHEQSLAQRYGVASIPMMILFENGEPQATAIGAMPKGALERALGLAEAAA